MRKKPDGCAGVNAPCRCGSGGMDRFHTVRIGERDITAQSPLPWRCSSAARDRVPGRGKDRAGPMESRVTRAHAGWWGGGSWMINARGYGCTVCGFGWSLFLVLFIFSVCCQWRCRNLNTYLLWTCKLVHKKNSGPGKSRHVQSPLWYVYSCKWRAATFIKAKSFCRLWRAMLRRLQYLHAYNVHVSQTWKEKLNQQWASTELLHNTLCCCCRIIFSNPQVKSASLIDIDEWCLSHSSSMSEYFRSLCKPRCCKI